MLELEETLTTNVTSLLFSLILLAGQLWLNRRFKDSDEKRAQEKREKDERHNEEKKWRDNIAAQLADQDRKIDMLMLSQASTIRSDIIHKCHRYLDDIGGASTDEKDALNAEWKEYSAFCAENEIENHFIDTFVQHVMELPNRKTGQKVLDDGFVKLTVDGGKVRDKRTGRTYRVVVCDEKMMPHFEAEVR